MIDDCVFCKVGQNIFPAAKVYEDEEVLAFFDQFPVARYHTLVVPKEHYSDLFDIPPDLVGKVMKVTQKIAKVYSEALDLKNLQLLSNCGRYAQQSVFHFHIHIIPRFPLDGNNINWQKHPEYQMEFSDMLSKLPRIE